MAVGLALAGGLFYAPTVHESAEGENNIGILKRILDHLATRSLDSLGRAHEVSNWQLRADQPLSRGPCIDIDDIVPQTQPFAEACEASHRVTDRTNSSPGAPSGIFPR